MKTRALLVAWALMLVTPLAHANGLFLSPSRFDPTVRSRMETNIVRAKADHREAFEKIQTLRGHRPEVYRQFRSQEPNVLPELLALGPGGAWAILEVIVFEKLERGDATQREWDALRRGLLLALAELEVREASPVFLQLFTSQQDPLLLQGAAIGLGRLGAEPERKALLQGLKRGGEARNAALEGLMYVRRIEVVRAVAPLLGDRSERTASLAVRTLGYVGSSWAWRTGNAGIPDQEMPIRYDCAQALLNAYLQHSRPVRERIARSLSMVEHPNTAAMITERISTTAEEADRQAWVDLQRRLGM